MQTTASRTRPFWIVLACLASLLASTIAEASTLVRSYTPRYSTTARGDLLVIGNTLMTCPASAANCTSAQGGGSFNNNSFSMEWVNADNVTVSPQNSSTATLNIPGGSMVVFAGLYWGADTSSGGGGAAPAPAISTSCSAIPSAGCWRSSPT